MDTTVAMDAAAAAATNAAAVPRIEQWLVDQATMDAPELSFGYWCIVLLQV